MNAGARREASSRPSRPPRLSFEFGPAGAAQAGRRGAVVVVVDVLRATTTLPLMLARGAVRVIPCRDRAEVERRRHQYPAAKRAGERLCRRLPGYDMGSSPTEIAGLDLTGQTILHSTTNGTRVVRAAVDHGARAVLTGSFATLTQSAATALHLAMQFTREGPAPVSAGPGSPAGAELALVATGRMGRFVLEDWLGVRHLALRIQHLWAAGPGPSDTDRSRRAGFKGDLAPWRPPMDPDQLFGAVRHSPSIAAIEEAGLQEDIQRCLAYDTLAVAPWFDGVGFVDYWLRS